MKVSKSIVYNALTKIETGKVITYGGLARLVGSRSPRWIGSVLHQNTDPDNIPCYKVVNAKGELARNFAFGGTKGQTERLEKEGIIVNNGRVDLNKYLVEE